MIIAVLEYLPSLIDADRLTLALHDQDPTVAIHHYVNMEPSQLDLENRKISCVVYMAPKGAENYSIDVELAKLSSYSPVIVLSDRDLTSRVDRRNILHLNVNSFIHLPSLVQDIAGTTLMWAVEHGSSTAEKNREESVFDRNISELGLPRKIENILMFQRGISFIGELVQHAEADLLALPLFGRNSLTTLKATLRRLGLKLDMDLPNWVPPPVSKQNSLSRMAAKLAAVKQEPLGATFETASDILVVNAGGTSDDAVAAKRPLIQQLHNEIERKAARFASVATRLDNQTGWQGIAAYCERLLQLLGRPTSEIPSVLGSLYGATLELGTYLEMDNAVSGGASAFAVPLDPEVRRPLEDLIASMAPWMRSFPSIRELDDEAGQFLTRSHLLDPSENLFAAANHTNILTREDVLVLQGLVDAARRGEFQGHKASNRSVSSARNMVLTAATAIATFMAGATSSHYATKSVIVQRAGDLLIEGERDILKLFADVPDDVRLAIEIMLREVRTAPPLPAQPSPERAPGSSEVRAPAKRRRGKAY